MYIIYSFHREKWGTNKCNIKICVCCFRHHSLDIRYIKRNTLTSYVHAYIALNIAVFTKHSCSWEASVLAFICLYVHNIAI